MLPTFALKSDDCSLCFSLCSMFKLVCKCCRNLKDWWIFWPSCWFWRLKSWHWLGLLRLHRRSYTVYRSSIVYIEIVKLKSYKNVHQRIKRQSCHYIETSQLILRANQSTGFYVMATLAFNELRVVFDDCQSTFDHVFENDHTFFIHHLHIQRIMTEMYNMPGSSLAEFFIVKEIRLTQRSHLDLLIPSVTTLRKRQSSLNFYGTLICNSLSYNIRNTGSLLIFRNY